KTCFHRARFALIRHNTNYFFRFEDLTNGHRDCPVGDLVNAPEPSFAGLLAAARFIESHYQIRLLGVEISRRVIERQVPILADPDKGNVDRSCGQETADFAAYLFEVALAVKQVIVLYPSSTDEPLEKVPAKARRMVNRQADVLIQVEHFNLFPIHT